MTTATSAPFYTYDASNLPDVADYQDDDILVLDQRVELTLHPDGRTSRTVRRAWLYISDMARHKASDVHILYRDKLQKLDLHAVTSWMRDGKPMETPDYGRNVITPYAVDRAPELGNFRQMVVSLVGTEPGAVSLLEYTIHDKKAWQDFFWGMEPLGEAFPALRRTFVLRLPAATPVTVASFAGAPEPVKTEDGGEMVYTWTVESVAPCDPEDSPPGVERLVPAALFSTVGDWKTVTEKLSARFDAGLKGERALNRLATEIAEETTDKYALALKLHKKVLEGVRTIDFPLLAHDLAFRPAAKVWESGWGTSLEKGMLLTALYRAAGLNARLLLGMFDFMPVDQIAFPGEPRVWVEVSAGRRKPVFDPTKPSHAAGRPNLEGVLFVPVSEAVDAPEAARVSRPSGRSHVEATLTLKPDCSLSGKVACQFEGQFNPFKQLSLDDKTTAEKYAAQCASKLFGGKAENAAFEILAPERTVVRFQLKDAKAQRAGARFAQVTWPDLPAALHGYSVPVHRSTRVNSIRLPGSAALSLKMKLNLPKDAKARLVPGTLKRRGEVMNVTVKTEAADGSVDVDASWRCTSAWVHPDEYEKFRKAMTATANPETRSILIDGF